MPGAGFMAPGVPGPGAARRLCFAGRQLRAGLSKSPIFLRQPPAPGAKGSLKFWPFFENRGVTW